MRQVRGDVESWLEILRAAYHGEHLALEWKSALRQEKGSRRMVGSVRHGLGRGWD